MGGGGGAGTGSTTSLFKKTTQYRGRIYFGNRVLRPTFFVTGTCRTPSVAHAQSSHSLRTQQYQQGEEVIQSPPHINEVEFAHNFLVRGQQG